MTSFALNKYWRKDDILKPSGYTLPYSSLFLSTIAINILSLALPIMTLQVYDRILPNPGTGTLAVLTIGVCIALILETILRLCRSYLMGRMGATYEHLLSCQTMKKILNADFSARGRTGVGENLNKMMSVRKLKDFYNGYSLVVLTELAMVPVFFILIFYISKTLVIVPAIILLIFTAISLWKGLELRQALKNREIADDKRFNFLIESLEGIHTLKSFALERFFQRHYEALEEESTFTNFKVTEATSSTFNIGAVFSHIMVAGVIGAGAYFVLNGSITTGALIATLLLSGRMMQPVQKALSLWARYQDYLLARQHIEDLIHTPQHPYVIKEQKTLYGPEGEINIENVEFSYKNPAKPVFKNLNLTVHRGETVLLSGIQGAGKTSLLKLIAGVYSIDNGDIVINSLSIKDYSQDNLTKAVGYISQDAIIFRGTIRDNITNFGLIREADAQEIATLLQIDSDVAKLPSGYDTFLNGDNSDNISFGLKQRIAFTRSLATKPKIILFDNADKLLDKDGYTKIYSLLARLKKKVAMIIVSEDRNICALADRNYHIENLNLQEITLPLFKGNISPYKELRL